MHRKQRIKEQILPLLDRAKKQKIFPGCQTGIVTNEWQLVLPFGSFTYGNDAQSVKRDSLYDVASITKAIPLSCLALKLMEEKKLSLSDKLVSFIPEYQGAFRQEITLLHLLTQTLSFPFSLSSFKEETSDQILERIMHAELAEKPGTHYNYSNATSILLGLIIERVSKRKLDVLADEYYFKPLRMQHTTFFPDKFPLDVIVPTEIVDGQMIQGVVHDESARILSVKAVVGSAGLFSTADDLLIFLSMLLSDGVLQGRHFFEPATIAKMCKGVVVANNRLGLGWEMNNSWMGTKHSSRAIGKTGFTGCFVFYDSEKAVGIVHLSNHIFPQRQATRERINHFRRSLIDTVLTVLS